MGMMRTARGQGLVDAPAVVDAVQQARMRASATRAIQSVAMVDEVLVETRDQVNGRRVIRLRFQPIQADAGNCAQRTCTACGRLTPAVYLVRHGAAVRCEDCAIDPGGDMEFAYGPSPWFILMEFMRTHNVRLKW